MFLAAPLIQPLQLQYVIKIFEIFLEHNNNVK